MPYVDLSFKNPLDDVGARMRQMDAYNTAGNSLAGGDYEGARNSLMQFGYPDAAKTVQTMQDSSDQNRRANAAEGRTVADRNLAQTIGTQYAGGDTQGAKNAAIAAGHLDLASNYGKYEASQADAAQDEAKRSAMAQAAKMTAAGDAAGARNLLMPYYSSVDNFMGDLQKSQKDVAQKAGQLALAYEGDPEGWVKTGVPALHKMGVNPEGFEDEAGRQALLAKAGLSSTVYKADQTQQLYQQKATSGTALSKNAGFIRTQFEQDPANAGVLLPPGELQKVAANPRGFELQTQTDPQTGTRQAVAVMLTSPKQGNYGFAVDAQKQNQDFNEKHADEIKAGTVQPKETDLTALYDHAIKYNIAQQNADTKSRMADPNVRGEISKQTTLGKGDAQVIQRAAQGSPVIHHVEIMRGLPNMPGFDGAIGWINQNGGAQNVANEINSGRVAVPSAYAHVVPTIIATQEELQRFFHTPGSGVVPESERERLLGLTAGLNSAPNRHVWNAQLDAIQNIVKPIINTALPSDVAKSPVIRKGQQESLGTLENASQGNFDRGPQAQAPAAAPQQSLLPVVDKQGQKLWFNPATGERTSRQ